MAVRFSIILLAIFCAYALLVFNLYDLQVVQGKRYVARADSQSSGVDWQVARRGSIFFTDRNDNSMQIATVKDVSFLYAIPKDMNDIAETAHQLAPVIGQSADELITTFEKKKQVVLDKKPSAELVNKVRDLKLKGIYDTFKPTRFYPLDSLAAHLIGFVGPDSEGVGESGRYGAEKFYDEKLKGGVLKEGEKTVDQGEDLYLTIDPNIQKEAEKILSDIVNRFGAAGGLAMVQDPRTGKVLALAGEPTFNPNTYKESELGTFLNPATQKLYEPGSIFKVLTMAAGIDAGKITPNTTYVDKGKMTINGRTVSNWDYKTHGAYGQVTMTNVIEHSINTGAIFAEKTTGHKIFTNYMKKFGLGEKTEIELPGELGGNLNRLNDNEPDVAFATAAYGQGVAVTPIGLLSSVSAIANKGLLMKPYINTEGTSTVVRRVISEKTAKQVTDMMVSAVRVNKAGHIPGYSIAAKTGTAFIPDFNHGGYTTDVFNTYIGYAPAYDPRFIVFFRLERPQGAPLAGTSVVPAFREMAQFLINYYDISPDRPEETQKSKL
ncbi:MAG: penicillin-binding protein 2 [Patescibacteria group bacterium]